MASSAAGEMIIQYEQMIKNYEDAVDELNTLETDIRRGHTGLDRSAAVQRDAVMKLRGELDALRNEINKQHLGHNLQAQFKGLQSRVKETRRLEPKK